MLVSIAPTTDIASNKRWAAMIPAVVEAEVDFLGIELQDRQVDRIGMHVSEREVARLVMDPDAIASCRPLMATARFLPF